MSEPMIGQEYKNGYGYGNFTVTRYVDDADWTLTWYDGMVRHGNGRASLRDTLGAFDSKPVGSPPASTGRAAAMEAEEYLGFMQPVRCIVCGGKKRKGQSYTCDGCVDGHDDGADGSKGWGHLADEWDAGARDFPSGPRPTPAEPTPVTFAGPSRETHRAIADMYRAAGIGAPAEPREPVAAPRVGIVVPDRGIDRYVVAKTCSHSARGERRDEVSEAAAREFLQGMWLDMRDGAGPEAQAHAAGAIETAHYLGALTSEQAELWLRRVRTSCPGHDDEGGRDWCAYCGKMPTPGSSEAP